MFAKMYKKKKSLTVKVPKEQLLFSQETMQASALSTEMKIILFN